MTDSQSTGINAPTPSSPLQHMGDTQSIGDQATPRASGMGLLAGGTYKTFILDFALSNLS